MLHPPAPFITEELWQRLPHEGRIHRWSAPHPAASAPPDATAEREMGPLMQAISVYPQHPRRDALQVLGPTLTVTV